MQNIKLENEITKIISKSPIPTDLIHAKSTRKWVLKLKPDSDYALQISALGHDVERGFDSPHYCLTEEKFNNYTKYKHLHSKKSANIIVKLLKKYDFDKSFIAKVKHLVLFHEFGGDIESNLLMNADSISFFENNLILYYELYGEDKARKKIKFMYNRMSDNAKKVVKKIKYKNKKLDLIFKHETSKN